MSEDMLPKYEAWTEKLQSNIRDMGRQKRAFHMMFFGSVIVSAIGFFWGVWLGVATFFTGVMVCVAGLYITMTRTWEYERELKRTQQEIARIRSER
jgi:hypothetical protein